MYIFFALKSIFRKGVRTCLTIAGIAVGVMSVVVIFTMSQTGEKAVSAELDSLGLNGISVAAQNENVSLEYSDAQIIRNIDGVKSATPILTVKTDISTKESTRTVMLWGVDTGKQFFKTDLLYGRLLTKSDIFEAGRVCLIDKSTSKALFSKENACGESITFSFCGITEKCRIVGITSADSSILSSISGTVLPDFVYLPHTLLTNMRGDKIDSIAVSINGKSTNKIFSKINSEFSRIKGVKNPLKYTDLSAQRGKLDSLLSTVTAVLSAIGVIALIVSGLSIMTVMLVSVNERTREIGVKKAIGAGFFDIFKEFLIESALISLIGGLVGALLGVIAVIVGGVLFQTQVSLNLYSVLFSLFCALLFGALFGIYPAIKAAKMKPADALRYE